MGIGVSVFLFAVGAILTFAVSWTVSGIDLATVGVILMIAGALGLVMTIAVFGRRGGTRQTVVDDYDDGYGRRRVVQDDVI
jgi:membrane protein implicated in regulation of membrane protease activity